MLSQRQEIDRLRAEVQELRARLVARDQADARRQETKTVLQSIAEGIAPATAKAFFETLATHLARHLQVDFVVVGKLTATNPEEIETVAFYGDGALQENVRYNLTGTPCENVINTDVCLYPSGVASIFNSDEFLLRMGVESYVGMPLKNSKGRPLGLIAVLDRKPMSDAKTVEATLKVFANRAAAEMESQQAVQSHENFMSFILETIPCGIVITRLDGTFQYANAATREIFGFNEQNKPFSVADFSNKTIFEDGRTCPVSEFSSIKCLQTRKRQPPQTLGLERPDGKITWAIYHSIPVVEPTTQEPVCLTAIIDITELKLSEAFHRLISEAAADYAYIADVKDGELSVSRTTGGFSRVTGYENAEELEAAGGWHTLIHPDDLPDAKRMLAKRVSGKKEPESGELRIVRRNNEIRWIHFKTHPVLNAKGEVIRFCGAIRDITDRKTFEKELKETAAARQRLAHRLLTVQEQERRHLAKELHDEFGQSLTALRMTLDDRMMSAEKRLAKARELVRELGESVRDMSRKLRPSMLDDLGLLPTLLWHLKRYEEQTGIRADLHHCGIDERLPSEVETGAYRIIQEALTNVARYAAVRNVAVQSWVDDETLFVCVKDDGKGFDPGLALSEGVSSGLSGMKERAELLGGRLTIESSKNHGTQIYAELPVRSLSAKED